MIKPTIGRVVLFNAGEDQPHAALIAYVHNDNLINIGGFDGRGVHFNEQMVSLVQDPEEKAKPGEAYWMIYQHAQEAKQNPPQDPEMMKLKLKQNKSIQIMADKSLEQAKETAENIGGEIKTYGEIEVFDNVENTAEVNRSLASHQINQPT